jgi:elongation factor G
MRYSPDAIRTVALVGHAGCVKTSLIEALLHQGGALQAPGSVERGTTVCDLDPFKGKYHHSRSLPSSTCTTGTRASIC